MLFKEIGFQLSDLYFKGQGSFVVGPEWERLVSLGTLSPSVRYLVWTYWVEVSC